MIYDPTDLNVAMNEDGSLMRRIITHDLAVPQADATRQQFVPMDEAKDFTRPEW